MQRLFYILLLGGLVLNSVDAEVDSTRESLERSALDDRSQMDDDEKVIPAHATIESLVRSPVNVRSLETILTDRVRLPPTDSGGQVPNITGRNTHSKNSKEQNDLSAEGNPLQLRTQLVSPVDRSALVDPAAQLVNGTWSNGEIKARTRSGVQGQRIIATNRLLPKRLNRGRTTTTTTTTANPIPGHSDEESHDTDEKTTTVRNLPFTIRIYGSRATTARSSLQPNENSSEEHDSVNNMKTTTSKPILTTAIRNPISRNGFGRFRTTTESVPVSNNSEEDSDLTKTTTLMTTTRSLTFQINRFDRVRKTTVPTSEASVEEFESVSVVPTATPRSLVFGNLFRRLRTSTSTSTDSNEDGDTVKDIQPTTTARHPVPKNRINRFQTTPSSNADIKHSEEQIDVTTATQTPVLRRLQVGNRFIPIRSTTADVPMSESSDEVNDAVNVTRTTSSRILIPGNRLSRFRTTTWMPVSKKDSEEQDDTVGATSTTTRSLASRNDQFNAIRATASLTIARDSIEEEDSVKITSTTTARNVPSRFRFAFTRTTAVPVAASTKEQDIERTDVVNKTTASPTQRGFLAGKRFSVLRISTPPPDPITSPKNSDEEDDSADANQTTTTPSRVRNRFNGSHVATGTPVSPNAEEQDSSVKKTQTIIRNSLLRNRFSHLQATPTGIATEENSNEQVDSENGTQTASHTLNHLAIPVTQPDKSDERDDMNKGPATTTARTRLTLRYFNRYRTTTAGKLVSRSEEQVDRSLIATRMTSNIQMSSTTSPSSFILPDKVNSSLEVANLGRKDRAIIYNTKTNIDVNHLNDFQTEPPVPADNYNIARHSDETDDNSEDEEDEENSDEEVDEFSLESYDTTIADRTADSDEILKDDMMTMIIPNAADIFKANINVDNSMEAIFFVTNNSASSRKQTATLLQSAKLLIDSDEGNDVSLEGEGSGAVPDDDVQDQTTPVQQNARVLGSEEGNDGSTESQTLDQMTQQEVRKPSASMEQSIHESEERSNISTETKASNKILAANVKIENPSESGEKDVNIVTESNEGNKVSAEGEVNKGPGDIREDPNKTMAQAAQESDENDESSLEVDASKLPEIKKLLTEAENERASTDVEDRAEAASSETRAILPDIDSLMKVDINHHVTAPAATVNETLIEDAKKKKEVNMKIRELLTNPIVQERLHERLQAIDGRLKDSKSARVKRLIEKYLAALAKLSPSTNSAAFTGFSVFFPLVSTCLLLAIS